VQNWWRLDRYVCLDWSPKADWAPDWVFCLPKWFVYVNYALVAD